MEKKSIFTISIPIEYRSMVNDLTRMITLQIITNYLFYLSNPSKYSFLGKDFIKLLLFIIISISFYWLVIRKIISYNKDDAKETDQRFYYGV